MGFRGIKLAGLLVWVLVPGQAWSDAAANAKPSPHVHTGKPHEVRESPVTEADRAPTLPSGSRREIGQEETTPRPMVMPPPGPPGASSVPEAFEVDPLAPKSPAIEKAIAGVETACSSNDFRREGPSPAEEARCSVALRALKAQGERAAPAIFAKLNHRPRSFYVKTALFEALREMKSESTRDVLISGFARIQSQKSHPLMSDGYEVERALRSVMGLSQISPSEWEDSEMGPSDGSKRAMAIRLEQRRFKGQTKAEVEKTVLTEARRDVAGTDPKKAYFGLRVLEERKLWAEASAATERWAEDPSLTDAERMRFESRAEARAALHRRD